jgi:hypothetical protein
MAGHESDPYAEEWRMEVLNYVRGHDFMRRLANRDRHAKARLETTTDFVERRGPDPMGVGMNGRGGCP